MIDAAPTTTRHRARRGVLLAYAVMLVVGAAFLLGSFDYDLTRGTTVGPGALPRVASGLLVALAIGLLIQELTRGSTLTGDSGAEEDQEPMTRRTALKLLSVFGLIALAIALVPLLGLLVPLALLVPTLMIVIERMPVVPSLLITAAALVVAYVLFIVVLRLPIPMGIFGGMF